MNIVKKLAIGLIGLCILLCLVSFVLPSKVHVERSILIDASRCTIYAQMDDYSKFNGWSPWAERDPNTKYTFSGPALGKGAKMAWKSSHPEVGEGSQTITDTKECESVTTALDFGQEGLATATFVLAKAKGGTNVTWGLDSNLDGVIARYFGLAFDGMIGPDYEKGLASLKKIAERLPKGDWEGMKFETVAVKAQPYAYVTTNPAKGADAIGKEFASAYGKVGQYMKAKSVASAGRPMSIVNSFEASGVVFDVGIPLASKPVEAAPADVEGAGDAAGPASEGEAAPVAPPDVKLGETPKGKAIKLVYKGPYKGIEAAAGGLEAYIGARAIQKVGPSWSQYISDPGNTEEADLITHIYQGIR